MRKVLIPALTALMVMAVAGIAYAANVYTVDGGTKPRPNGSAKKPVPVSLDFSYPVADESDANRGIPVKEDRDRGRGPGDLSGGVPELFGRR